VELPILSLNDLFEADFPRIDDRTGALFRVADDLCAAILGTDAILAPLIIARRD
jgi:hypothetical protein